MLRGRAAGPHRYDDEVAADGGKVRLRRQVRRVERAAWQRDIRTDRTA
jgi:hypothetical protein